MSSPNSDDEWVNVSSTKLDTIDQVKTAVDHLKVILDEVHAACAEQSTSSADEFDRFVNHRIEEASDTTQKIALYFQEHKHLNSDAQSRNIHRDFVARMHELKSMHHEVTVKREVICDQDLLRNVNITVQDLALAKEEEVASMNIAKDTLEIKKVFTEVETITRKQAPVINQIGKEISTAAKDVENGVSELEVAQQLQRELRRKQMLIAALILIVLAGLIVAFKWIF